jgi:hypothetical protein
LFFFVIRIYLRRIFFSYHSLTISELRISIFFEKWFLAATFVAVWNSFSIGRRRRSVIATRICNFLKKSLFFINFFNFISEDLVERILLFRRLIALKFIFEIIIIVFFNNIILFLEIDVYVFPDVGVNILTHKKVYMFLDFLDLWFRVFINFDWVLEGLKSSSINFIKNFEFGVNYIKRDF